MTTPPTHNISDDETPCDDSASVWPMRLATRSALFLGCLLGRVGFGGDVREALRRIEESPEPINISIRAL